MNASFLRSHQTARLCAAIVISWIFLYLYVAILPSYQSGLYRLSEMEIEQGHFEVPGYTFEPIHGHGNWRVYLALFSIVGTRCLVLPLALISAFALFVGRTTFPWQEKLFWVILWLTILLILWLTAPAANAFTTWLVD